MTKSFFWNICWNFFWGLFIYMSNHLRKKKIQLPWNSVYMWENSKIGLFWGEFCLSIILPWSCSKVTKKFCRKLFTWNENFHFKFFRNPSIFGRAVNKKMISLCFTGPFWAFLGTPTITYHHDSLSISLLHQEV